DALDPVQPATLSSKILIDLLRRDMGFQGLVITDAMDMQAVASLGTEESVRRALRAGADLVLLAHLPDQLSLTSRTRPLWNQRSLDRIRDVRMRLRTEIPPLSVVGCAEHQAVAQRIADASVTLAHGSLPLPLDSQLAVITVQPRNLTPADSTGDVEVTLAAAVRRRQPDALALTIEREADDQAISTVLAVSAPAHTVIVGTNDAYRDPSQQRLIRQIKERGQRVYVVALRTPYDAAWLPFVDALLCVYSVRAASCEAAARALFGELVPSGTLPCSLPHVDL
ncbi:MAG: glycoside hydrolase family 3 C-terminal domain-containing protein, partial [Anaerolinea sp.]|nr:glycoside hydrolase family 3 C-terminal domain-containing protein [Anaerolinea sp.]